VALGAQPNLIMGDHMQLRETFESGLTPERYTELLNDDQRDLHALYQRRVEIDADAVDRLRSAGPFHVLVITEPWCGDSLAVFPVIVELCQRAGIELRVVRRDEHLDLIDRYLTNGGRGIPIAVVLDESFEEVSHWGPRPRPAQAIFDEHREKIAAGRIEKSEVHKKIRAFYARDKGQTVVEELLAGFGVDTSQPI
jgi:hypothetical protein